MPINDALQLKERIISIIKTHGPILPVQIAKQTGLSILFASAFLSELYNEKRLEMSNLRVGSSPLYFVPGQEAMLENFYQYLKSKEKEAFLFLKEQRFLRDAEQSPAIRVALREIKDYAVPFRNNEETYWRYFTVPMSEFQKANIELPITNEKEIIIEHEQKPIAPIFEKEKVSEVKEKEEAKAKKQKTQSKTSVKKKQKKPDENFFNKIKEFLAKNRIEIIDIKNFKSDEAVLKVKKDEEEQLLFAFNKKKITEKDILKSGKEALESKMSYSIFHLGETPKKYSELISAIRGLSEIGKIE